MKYVTCALVALSLVVSLKTPVDAQQRRRTGGSDSASSTPVVLPKIASDPARPLVGVWEGQMIEGMDGRAMPYALVIEFLNGAYTSYSVNPGGVEPHKAEKASGNSFHWEQPNMSNNGTLVFDVTMNSSGAMTGTMKLVGGNFDPPASKLELHRKQSK